MKKQLFSVILGASIMASCVCVPAGALAPDTLSTAAVQVNGIPAETDTKVITPCHWGGKAVLRSNVCYYIDDTVTINKKLVLPESSMLVVRNGGTLRISSGGKLTLKGAAVIHDGGKLHISKSGSLIVKSTSVLVNYGTLAVSRGGCAGIYGYAQSEGSVNVKGRLYITKNGILAADKVMKYSGSSVKGSVQPLPERPLYYAQQLEPAEERTMTIFSNETGREYTAGQSERKKVATAFEAVLYKYAGEITLPENTPACDYIIDIHYNTIAEVTQDDGTKHIVCGCSNWGGIPVIEDNDFDRVLTGCYYQAVLGKQDKSLLLTLLDGGVEEELLKENNIGGVRYRWDLSMGYDYFAMDNGKITTVESSGFNKLLSRLDSYKYLGKFTGEEDYDLCNSGADMYLMPNERVRMIWRFNDGCAKPSSQYPENADLSKVYLCAVFDPI